MKIHRRSRSIALLSRSTQGPWRKGTQGHLAWRRTGRFLSILSLIIYILVFVPDDNALWCQEENSPAYISWNNSIKEKEALILERFISPPQGDHFSRIVPDTLDLADRANQAINCLTGALDPERGYEIYFYVNFSANPPIMTHDMTGFPTNNPKFAESLPMMRLMSGSLHNVEVDRRMMARMLALIADDGLFYVNAIGRPWNGTSDDFANVYGNSRLMLAMMAWYQYDKNPMWLEYLQKMSFGLRKNAVIEGDKAYFLNPGIGEVFSRPRSGYPPNLPRPSLESNGNCVAMYFCGVIRALSKWSQLSGDQESLDFTRKLVNFVREKQFWVPVPITPGINGADRAHFSIHIHAYAALLRGLLEYAMVTNDTGLKEFVRSGYEYARNFGIAGVGWSPECPLPKQMCEACCIADLAALAVKLSDSGVGDYWEDVDRYVRNQLVEQQITHQEFLLKFPGANTPDQVTPSSISGRGVIDRNLGGFMGRATVTGYDSNMIMHCCTGNATQALFHAWESIVRDCGNNVTQINLLLNRVSPWLDIESYLPYEGKVVIKNRTSREIRVRIPLWVSHETVTYRVGAGESCKPSWMNNYMILRNLVAGDEVTIEFPIHERMESATLDDQLYTLHFRGNTVITIDTNQSVRIEKGSLSSLGKQILSVDNLACRDVLVSVDAESSAEAGIIMRFKDPNNFLLAHYNSALQQIYFHEVVNGEYTGGFSTLTTGNLGPTINLKAQVKGLEAEFSVGDGKQEYTIQHTLKSPSVGEGAGLFTNNLSMQHYDHFMVLDYQDKILFQDSFDGPDGSFPEGWSNIPGESPLYPLYDRANMNTDKAPVVEKNLYLVNRHIDG